MAQTYAVIQSRIGGAWPGEIGRSGRLPRAWSLVLRGLNAAVMATGTVGPADTFDVRFYGVARSAGGVMLYMGPVVAVQGGAQDIATTLGMAVVGGRKNNINRAMIGVETRDGGGAAIALPQNDVVEWPELGPQPRIVRNTVPVAAGFATAIYFFSLDVVVNQPIDITLRFGWSFAESASGGALVRATWPALTL